MFATGETAGLVEWIIYDTCLGLLDIYEEGKIASYKSLFVEHEFLH